MDSEITRASSADRDRYAYLVPGLFTDGYLSEEDMHAMIGRILQAETLAELDRIMDGYPKPPHPRRPRDMGIPGNFLPACAAASLVGITVAVVPTAALSGNHSAFAAVATGLALCWGIWIVIVAIIAAVTGAFSWDNQDSHDQRERRKKDRQGR